MKIINLEGIPKYTEGRYKGKYNWKLAIGVKCNFTYHEVSGELEILDYNSKKQRVKVKYRLDELWINTSHLKLCKIGNLIGKKTKDYKYMNGAVLLGKSSQIKIISQLKINNIKGYKYKCLKCNYEGEVTEGNLSRGSGCPVCCLGSRKVCKGVNDIASQNQMLWKMMDNSDEGYKYTQHSRRKINWKCTNCGGNIIARRIIDVNKRGLNCPCSTSNSYGEKTLCYIFKDLNIEFQVHRRFEWSDGREYDFYLPATNTIVEVNGIQHYSDSFESCGGRSLDDEQKNDKYKESLAKENSIDNYVVIDARKTKFEYIKTSIIDSNLILNLNNIDWDIIESKVREETK